MTIAAEKVPKEVLTAETRYQQAQDAVDELLRKHKKVMEEFQSLVAERNASIEEMKKLCKRHKCSTTFFKTVEKTGIEYDPAKFLEQFGAELLVKCAGVKNEKVKAYVTTGELDELKLRKAIDKDEPTYSVSGPKTWVID